MNITLYKAAIDVQHKINLCVDDDGVLDMDKLHAIEATFINKGVAVTAVIKTLEVSMAGLIAQKRAIDEQYQLAIERAEKQHDNLCKYLQDAMKSTNVLSINSDDGLLHANLYIDRDESVEIDEGATFPDSLLNPQKPAPARTPSKALIKAAIEAGEPINGARIVRKDRLTIK